MASFLLVAAQAPNGGNFQFTVVHSAQERKLVKTSVLAIIALVILSGCSIQEPQDVSVQTPSTSPPSSSPNTPTACDVVTERAMNATIGTQIEAFRVGDFEAAYEMAAPAFQANVSVELFEGVITGGYQSLLEAESHTLSDCIVFPQSLANTVVTVRTTGGSTSTYYYEMVDTDQGWRILGATAIAPAVPEVQPSRA